jgi:hypothetical protein
MNEERFQQMEKRLNEQVEATRAMNETLNKFSAVMASRPPSRSPHTTCNYPSAGIAALQS